MAEKNLNARIIHKHDTEANWLKAENFIPKKGELIVYDKDVNYNYNRFKIGDGETFVNNLPFSIEQSDWNQTDETQNDFIKNKPIASEYKLLFSTDYEPIDNIRYEIGYAWGVEYSRKISNYPVKVPDEVIGGYRIIYYDDQEPFIHQYTAEDFTYSEDVKTCWQIDAGTFIVNENTSFGNDNILTPGIYVNERDLSESKYEFYIQRNVIRDDFISDTIARKTDILKAQVQSDWKQSNETQLDYIKNKTHWEYQDILLPDTEINIVDHLCTIENFTFNIPNYEKYFITINGVDHEVTYLASSSVVQLSNQDNTIGVLVAYMGSQTQFWYSEDGTYTVSVRGETIHKLDKKFLPVATDSSLGAVKPIVKTEDMTQSVGVDENGALWTTKVTSPYSLNLEWDGNTEGHTVVTPTETTSTYGLVTSESLFVKMSDECPASSHLIGAVIDVYYNNNGEVTSGDTVITNDNINYISSYNTTAYSIFDGWIMIIPKPTTIRFEQGKVLSFEESGIYFRYMTLSTGEFGYTTKLEVNSEKLNSSLLVKEPLIIDIMSGTNTYEAAYTYDGSEPLTISLGMPVATETAFGVVKPVTKTDAMTQSVGIDENGALWTSESVQADWQETDETSKAYIANKPFYDTTSSRIIYENAEVHWGRNEAPRIVLDAPIEIVEGKTYTVPAGMIWAGTDIGGSGVAVSYDDAGFEIALDSGVSILIQDSFIIFGSEIDLNGIGHGSFTLLEVSGELVTIDEKFIPPTIHRVGDDLILNSSTEGSTKKFKLTIDDNGVLTATEIVE